MKRNQEERLAPTDQLVADLVAAGGTLSVAAWPRQGERDYRAIVGSAQRFGKVPSGKRIVMSQNRDSLEIRLEDAIEGTQVELQPVPSRRGSPRRTRWPSGSETRQITTRYPGRRYRDALASSMQSQLRVSDAG